MATNTNSYTGKFFFVSGIQNGRTAFLGRAVDQPYEGYVTLEGKSVHFGNNGFFTLSPFTTLTRFPIQDPNVTIHQIANNPVFEEVKSLFERPITQISRTSYPLFYRWMETCLYNENNGSYFAGNNFGGNAFGTPNNPFFGFYDGFVSSANQFRRALFQAPQVHSTRELDKVTDLEGNLTIDIGKITNQIAIKFNQFVGRNSELSNFFESFQSFHFYNNSGNTNFGFNGFNGGYNNGALAISGWTFLMNRMQVAKHWARRKGDTALVRELNSLTKECINHLNEVILEHCSALDILIAEAFSQYGITTEIYGEMQPFNGYTSSTPSTSSWQSQGMYNTPMPTGAGY